MKNFINLFYLFFCIFFLTNLLRGQACNNTELCIYNETGYNIDVKLFPVSMVFDGFNVYNLVAADRSTTGTCKYDYIAGVSIYGGSKHTFHTSYGFTNRVGFEWELNENQLSNPLAQGVYGSGIYKLEIKGPFRTDSCLIEFDYFPWQQSTGDLWFRINSNSPPNFWYKFSPGYAEIPISYSEPKYYKVECWKPWGAFSTRQLRNKCYGPDYSPFNGFYIYKEDPGVYYSPYRYFPLDCRRDCNSGYYVNIGTINQDHDFGNYPWDCDDRQGILTLNLRIDQNVQTTTVTWANGTYPYLLPVIITQGATLKLSANKNITLSPVSQNYDGFIMTNKTGGSLIFENSYNNPPTSKIIIENKNRLVLDPVSYVTMNLGNINSNSEILIKPGGILCDDGAIKYGYFKVRYYNGRHYIPIQCTSYPDYHYNDSTILVLDDSASLEIPDNTTLYFQDPTTLLKMNANSEIKMGYNSKLVFSDGARLIADQAKFTSLNAGGSWDGIYLEDISNDTLTNCTIENAVNGVNIIDKSNAGIVQPSTEISNCTFVNYIGSAVPNALYISNSNNVLVRNCNFTSDIDNGFSTGILIQYCPSGYLNIIDNELEKCATGIAVVQSSPYIARNTITNTSSYDNGIFIDNTNGTIEYNTFTGFNKSLKGYYSSPYVLKNIFDSPLNINFDVYSNSVPVLCPINSGTTLSWLGGNNTFTGETDSSALHFEDNSYIETDSGFNVVNQPNTEFYMFGSLPAEYNGMLTTYNFWGDATPYPGKFNVTGGRVYYEPWYDNGEIPPTNRYELNSIGFDLYDTVYIQDLGGDNPAAEKLFMQAYKKEMMGEYLNAISLYKQVITSYKNTSFATVALTRAFNCYEKKRSNITEYLNFSTYLGQVFNNNTIPMKLRRLAEDFIIKTKVRRYLLNDAINDYTNMFQQNQNNSQGIHALINKQCLIAMLRDTGDNPGNKYSLIANNKNEIISIINNSGNPKYNNVTNNIIPKQYRLYQNYPNPFNPVTTIKYDLPNDGIVKIIVYDIIGRIVYSYIEFKTAGTHSFLFDGINLSSGVYFYRLEAGQFNDVKRMVLIK